MTEQLKIMFYLTEGVSEWKKYKINRLSQMIREAEKNNASYH
jgi:hypothetical protein